MCLHVYIHQLTFVGLFIYSTLSLAEGNRSRSEVNFGVSVGLSVNKKPSKCPAVMDGVASSKENLCFCPPFILLLCFCSNSALNLCILLSTTFTTNLFIINVCVFEQVESYKIIFCLQRVCSKFDSGSLILTPPAGKSFQLFRCCRSTSACIVPATSQNQSCTVLRTTREMTTDSSSQTITPPQQLSLVRLCLRRRWRKGFRHPEKHRNHLDRPAARCGSTRQLQPDGAGHGRPPPRRHAGDRHGRVSEWNSLFDERFDKWAEPMTACNHNNQISWWITAPNSAQTQESKPQLTFLAIGGVQSQSCSSC